MKKKFVLNCAVSLAVVSTWAGMAWGYPLGPALNLEKLTEEADIIFKGTAVASSPAEDDWFKPTGGFVVRETQFNLVSVIKGQKPGDKVKFRHYDVDTTSPGSRFMPQNYHFETGRTYVVFAKASGTTGVYRQLWLDHKTKPDQGAVLCANDKPVSATTVKGALWAELAAMLTSTTKGDAAYGIEQLDQMSGGSRGFDSVSDFDRKEVLAAVHDLMAGSDAKIAQAAIAVVGSHNPYLSDERTIYWLATVGSAPIPGIGKMDPHFKNVGGTLYEKDLVALADGKAADETRAAAIQALGLVREPALQKSLDTWGADPAPAVRAAAAVLHADFPGPALREHLTALAGDAEPQVRAAVARAAGFAQQADLADVLGKLLTDKDATVRRAAALSLLSFAPTNPAIAGIFKANLENEEFAPLFLIALARANPADHLEALAKAVELKSAPKDFWGGQIPAFTAWEILFKYLQAQPAEKLRSGALDRYLDALEKVGNYSSSEPRDIYALYVQRGLADRADKFRQAAIKAVTYDLDYYFKQVDENPSLYKRE